MDLLIIAQKMEGMNTKVQSFVLKKNYIIIIFLKLCNKRIQKDFWHISMLNYQSTLWVSTEVQKYA